MSDRTLITFVFAPPFDSLDNEVLTELVGRGKKDHRFYLPATGRESKLAPHSRAMNHGFPVQWLS